jgi:hypothetical protein
MILDFHRIQIHQVGCCFTNSIFGGNFGGASNEKTSAENVHNGLSTNVGNQVAHYICTIGARYAADTHECVKSDAQECKAYLAHLLNIKYQKKINTRYQQYNIYIILTAFIEGLPNK